MPSVSELNRQIEKATSAYSYYSDLVSTYRRKAATAKDNYNRSNNASSKSRYQKLYDRYSASASNYASLRDEQYDKWQTLNSQLAQSKAANSEPASSNSSTSGSSSKKDSDGDGVVTADDVMAEVGGLACENSKTSWWKSDTAKTILSVVAGTLVGAGAVTLVVLTGGAATPFVLAAAGALAFGTTSVTADVLENGELNNTALDTTGAMAQGFIAGYGGGVSQGALNAGASLWQASAGAGLSGAGGNAVNQLLTEGDVDWLEAIGSGLVTAITFGTANALTESALVKGADNLAEEMSNSVEILGRGSTGRTVANNLNEQFAMKEVMSNPLENATTVPLNNGMTDSKWLGTEGWTKMQRAITTSDGENITIHFNYNEILGVFDDFKFK